MNSKMMKKQLFTMLLVIWVFSTTASAQTYKLSYQFKAYKFFTNSFDPSLINDDNMYLYQQWYHTVPDTEVTYLKCEKIISTGTHFCSSGRLIEKIETGISYPNLCEAIKFARQEIIRRSQYVKTSVRVDGLNRIVTDLSTMNIYLDDPLNPVCSIISSDLKALLIDKDDSFYKDSRFTNKDCGCE
ncbi:MAG: hypothetical protein COA67_11815 [Lutibacter sp.]|nr:MAG: hypothetical protein COA67_11815 [Lutibacter sp.]